jgi:hypothetical protein
MPATAADFRNLALSLPEAIEASHMGHPDFRVGGKIFATLDAPEKGWAMVKLTPEEQEVLLGAEPDMFTPAAGAWGRGGATLIKLKAANKTTLKSALLAAWRHRAPKRFLQSLPRRGAKGDGI